jgi:hypothetical protein
MGVWIYTLGSIPYLSSPASGSPSGAVLYAHTTRSSYSGADKWAQVPLISRHWMTKWWCSSAEMECTAHPVCAAPRRFGNRGHNRLSPCNFCCATSHQFGDCGHDCLRPRDFCCAVTAHVKLRCVTVPPGASNITTSCVNHGLPRINRAAPSLQNSNIQDTERLHGKGCWPHPRARSLSWGGPGGHCRYPKDRVPPRTSSKSRQKPGQLRSCRMSPQLWHPLPVSGQLRGRHVSSRLQHQPSGSRQLWSCHVSRGRALQAAIN